MSSLFRLFTVIGGKNVYLRLSLAGECDRKDFVWMTLQKEVLYSVVPHYNMESYFVWFQNNSNQLLNKLRILTGRRQSS